MFRCFMKYIIAAFCTFVSATSDVVYDVTVVLSIRGRLDVGWFEAILVLTYFMFAE